MYLPDAIDAYLSEMETSGLAETTVYNQGLFIKRFRKTSGDLARARGKRAPFQVREIDSGCIAAYFADCSGGQGNRNNMTIALRKFLNWAELGRMLPAGQTSRLMATRKTKKAERAPKHYVPAEQFPRLISSAERHPADRASMSLALWTLARRSEIADLRMRDIDLASATLHVWRGKRKRWTDIGICPDLMDELMRWLEWMATEFGYGNAQNMMESQPEWRVIPRLEPLYRREHGRIKGVTGYEMDPLSPQQHLERVVKRGLDATGAVTDTGKTVRHVGEGMHTIRRSGARAMLKFLSESLGDNRALVQVSTMLDHEDTRQTLVYIGMDQEREQLNDWLRGNSLYGGKTSVRHLRAV
jgi:integrase